MKNPIVSLLIFTLICGLSFSQSIFALEETVIIRATVLGCGDQIIQDGEQCDGNNLAGQTCSSLGFLGGDVSCNSDCTFNTSLCSDILPAVPAPIGIGTFYIPGTLPTDRTDYFSGIINQLQNLLRQLSGNINQLLQRKPQTSLPEQKFNPPPVKLPQGEISVDGPEEKPPAQDGESQQVDPVEDKSEIDKSDSQEKGVEPQTEKRKSNNLLIWGFGGLFLSLVIVVIFRIILSRLSSIGS